MEDSREILAPTKILPITLSVYVFNEANMFTRYFETAHAQLTWCMSYVAGGSDFAMHAFRAIPVFTLSEHCSNVRAC